jgi:hypothetical protein
LKPGNSKKKEKEKEKNNQPGTADSDQRWHSDGGNWQTNGPRSASAPRWNDGTPGRKHRFADGRRRQWLAKCAVHEIALLPTSSSSQCGLKSTALDAGFRVGKLQRWPRDQGCRERAIPTIRLGATLDGFKWLALFDPGLLSARYTSASTLGKRLYPFASDAGTIGGDLCFRLIVTCLVIPDKHL